MKRVRGPVLVVAVLLAGQAPAMAEPDAWHTLLVPTAVFDIVGIPLEDDRSQILLRLIRVLHTLPAGHPDVQPMHRTLAAWLADVNALFDAVEALPGEQIAMPAAGDRRAHVAIGGALQAAGLRLRERDRRFIVEIDAGEPARQRRERLRSAGINPDDLARRVSAGDAVRPALAVVALPLPLGAHVWAEAVFQRVLPARVLFSAIISDRNAALLYYGLCALTPETRAFLSANPDLLRWMYRYRAGTLASYGGSLRVTNGQVDVPGGDDARTIWESLTGRTTSQPAEFLREVLHRGDGRLAYLYETIDVLDSARQRVALGFEVSDPSVRAERLQALYRVFAEVEAEWAHSALPFSRPMYDAAMFLRVARTAPDGGLGPPASRRLWRLAFDSDDLPSDPAGAMRGAAEDGALDGIGAAALVALAPARHRRERFEAFAFGQRVFAGASDADLGDVLVAVRGFVRFPAVMLVLERIGMTTPAIYAAAARHALAIARMTDPARQIPLQAQFQGALAIVDRLSRTGAVAPGRIEPLLRALFASAPDGPRGYGGAIAAWVEERLLPALAARGSAEEALLAGFADANADGVRLFEWEGLPYWVDVAAAEHRRIQDIRAKQEGNSLDAVLAFARDARALAAGTLAMDRVEPAVASLIERASALAPARPWPGMDRGRVPDSNRAIERAARDLLGTRQPRQAANALRIAAPLIEAADYLLGEVLVALAYAPLLGDPSDLVGGEADVAHRHDFGAGTAVNAAARRRTPWLRPRQTTSATVVGAILGLDLALAPRALRRLASDRVPELPRLRQNDLDVFATSVVLMNPRHFNDADLQVVARAVRAGRTRVIEAARDAVALDALAAAAEMSPARRQLLGWAAVHEPAAVPELFSAMEMFHISARPMEDTSREAFGLTEEPLTGCYCRRFPVPGPWEVYAGRPGTGQLATRLPDLTLRLAELLDELGAPAALFPSVLALATQDFIDEVPTLFADDWPAAVAYARTVSRERVEDYVASLTAGGPLRPISSNQP